MIAVDTSALIAIIFEEALGPTCADVLGRNEGAMLSAGSLVEALVVSRRRNASFGVLELIEQFEIEVVPVTADSARRAGAAYARWGKALHPAGLNFGDCFAYELAESRGCPLLYIGNDFSQTDIRSALDAEPPEN